MKFQAIFILKRKSRKVSKILPSDEVVVCAAGKRNNYFNLHCGFKSHHGNTKEDIRHCLQDYHIERVQLLKKNKT